MIYLFEDRKDRNDRINYYLNNSLEGKYINESVVLNCSLDDLKTYIVKNCFDKKEDEKADLVLIHKSYKFPQDKNISTNDVKRIFNENNVSVIIFSGEIENCLTRKDNFFNGTVKSSDMYKNLHYFLEQYDKIKVDNRNSEQIQYIIPILLYGKKYLRNSLLVLQKAIYDLVFDKDENDLIIEGRINKRIIFLLETSLMEFELIQEKENFIQWLNENPNITIKKLLSHVQKIVEKY